MQKLVTKIVSSLLAIVVLFSTMSFTIDKHYCGKLLVDVAINKKAKTCGMEVMLFTQGDSLSKKSCCQNEHIVILGQDELKKNFESAIDFPLGILVLDSGYFQLEQLWDAYSLITTGNHDPPDRQLNFQILYETYLI